MKDIQSLIDGAIGDLSEAVRARDADVLYGRGTAVEVAPDSARERALAS